MPLVFHTDCPCCGQKMPPQSHHEPYRYHASPGQISIAPHSEPEGLALYLAREIAFAKRVLTAFGDFGRGLAHLFPQALAFTWYWGRYVVPCVAAMCSARWVGHLTYFLVGGHRSDIASDDFFTLGLLVYAVLTGLVFSVIWIADHGRQLREKWDNLP